MQTSPPSRASVCPPTRSPFQSEALLKYRCLHEASANEGSCLGLALVRAVAGLRGGAELRLENTPPGLRAVLTLPRIKHADNLVRCPPPGND